MHLDTTDRRDDLGGASAGFEPSRAEQSRYPCAGSAMATMPGRRGVVERHWTAGGCR